MISKDQETQKAKVLSYAHILDSCCQDWCAVVSILENLFQNIKVNFPNVKQTFLRSDEAGCYRCNQQQSKMLEIEWELQLHVMIFQNPSKERLFVTGCFFRRQFSELDNFRFEESGIREWKAYAVGVGRLIPWQSLYIRHQGCTNISLMEAREKDSSPTQK